MSLDVHKMFKFLICFKTLRLIILRFLFQSSLIRRRRCMLVDQRTVLMTRSYMLTSQSLDSLLELSGTARGSQGELRAYFSEFGFVTRTLRYSQRQLGGIKGLLLRVRIRYQSSQVQLGVARGIRGTYFSEFGFVTRALRYSQGQLGESGGLTSQSSVSLLEHSGTVRGSQDGELGACYSEFGFVTKALRLTARDRERGGGLLPQFRSS